MKYTSRLLYFITKSCKNGLIKSVFVKRNTKALTKDFKIKAVKETKNNLKVLFSNNSFTLTFIKPLINITRK